VRRLLLGIILLGLTAAVTSPAAAQVAIGAKGGINFSDVSATDNGVSVEPPFESRTGLLVGASVGVNLTPWLALQLEGRYSQEGTQQEEAGVNILLRLCIALRLRRGDHRVRGGVRRARRGAGAGSGAGPGLR
jgi:hypothetical protein